MKIHNRKDTDGSSMQVHRVSGLTPSQPFLATVRLVKSSLGGTSKPLRDLKGVSLLQIHLGLGIVRRLR